MSGSPIPRDGGPLVFVDDLDRPEPAAADRHHLERVLRLRAGDALICGDGAGSWRPARWEAGGVVPVDEIHHEEPPARRIGVAFVVAKGHRPELVVEKLTEAGVDDIAPLHSERSVVRWDATRAERNHGRLVRVAREACAQCRRARWPSVEPPREVAEMLAATNGSLAMAEPGGAPPAADLGWILVGPEGGWSADELALAPTTVTLGPHVYRSETAAIAAGILMAAVRDGVVAPFAPD